MEHWDMEHWEKGRLLRRFYERAEHAATGEEDGFAILLDGRGVRTPTGRALAVPSEALAGAIAAEWMAGGDVIEPGTMALTGLANTAIDGVAGREAAVVEEIVRHGASDAVLYRARAPAGLVAAERALWDPPLAWAEDTLGARFETVTGIRHVPQSPETLARLEAAVAAYDAFALAGLHVMTALLGSALLALAHVTGRLSLDEAWAGAHVDEDWQWERWGEEAAALARRAARRTEMEAASRFLTLLDDG